MADHDVVEGEIVNETGMAPYQATGLAQQVEQAGLDMQIATAKKYPRTIAAVKNKLETLIKNNRKLAEACVYKKPAGGQIITGPSARFAEMVAQAWGNLRIASMLVEVGDDRVVARGMCLDLECNVAEAIDFTQSIRKKNNQRYGNDQIDGIVGSAQSKARRTAILAIVPKVHWEGAMRMAQEVALGELKTLPDERRAAIEYLKKHYKLTTARILAAVGCKVEEEIDLQKLSDLRAFAVAMKEGDATIEQCFPPVPELPGPVGAVATRTDQVAEMLKKPEVTPPAEVPPPADVTKPAPSQQAGPAEDGALFTDPLDKQPPDGGRKRR